MKSHNNSKQCLNNNNNNKQNQKDKGRESTNTIFLRGLANSSYVHASKLTKFKDSTIQAFTTQGFKIYNWLLRYQSILTIWGYSKPPIPSVSQTYNHSIMILKLSLQRNFPHTFYVFTNESPKRDLIKEYKF